MSSRSSKQASELSQAMSACRGAFAAVGVFTGVINILMLTGSLFMLQVYDRVLPSRSVPTLVSLLVLVVVLYSIQGVLEVIRMRLLARIGRLLDDRLNASVYRALVILPLRLKSTSDGLQSIRDLDQIRGFLSGIGPTALFDLPWMPLYLAICFAFHFWIGMTAVIGAAILVALTILTETFTRIPAQETALLGSKRIALANASHRNAEVLQAMGMMGPISALWTAINLRHMNSQQKASDVAGILGSISRILRMFLQSAVLAVGAYLVIMQESTGGIIIASSILVSRALAPIELAIANWRGFVGARQSWTRLSDLLGLFKADAVPMSLPNPVKTLSVELLSVAPPGLQRIVAQDISFQLTAGQGMGVIGPSASGKSSLIRAIVGVWLPLRGKVRLDAAALEQWSADELGRHIGYLPQDIELFEGTIAQNIARFDPELNSDAIIHAARSAGVHELILRLPYGYATDVGEAGFALSAGQRQRVALARALYNDPFLVVLDEPNSNLDADGDQALTQAILGVRARKGIVIVIAHRPSALTGVDHVLAMANGRAQAFGPKEEIMRKVLDSANATPRPLKMVNDIDGKIE